MQDFLFRNSRMRFAIVVLVILLGAGAVRSTPSTRRSSTTHLMKKLLVQLLTRGSESQSESKGSESASSDNSENSEDSDDESDSKSKDSDDGVSILLVIFRN